MKYMLLICGDENLDMTPAEQADMDREADAWVAETGKMRLDGNRLALTSDARSVRVREGQVLVSDGPFAESKEQLGGYDLLECDSLEQAVELASRHPVARVGTIEVRPLWDYARPS